MISDARESSERSRAILHHLIRERQLMHREAGDESLFEANRLAIIYWQRQLSRVLGADRGATEVR